TAVINEDRVRDVLGLDRGDGLAYAANQIGKGPTVANWDRLDGSLPEYTRYSLEQLYFPPGLGTILALPGDADWCGLGKKEMLERWQSWLIIFQMIEDDNEGVFGPPPPRGNADRISQQMLGVGRFTYNPTANTRAAWAMADADCKDILERDGLATVTPWTNDLVGAYTVHPLASCRIGDDPHTSALDDRHELRGHPGIFVTDGSAVPGALTVNPAMTISALAERAVPGIVRAARERGVAVKYGAPAPDGSTSGRSGTSALVPALLRDRGGRRGKDAQPDAGAGPTAAAPPRHPRTAARRARAGRRGVRRTRTRLRHARPARDPPLTGAARHGGVLAD